MSSGKMNKKGPLFLFWSISGMVKDLSDRIQGLSHLGHFQGSDFLETRSPTKRNLQAVQTCLNRGITEYNSQRCNFFLYTADPT